MRRPTCQTARPADTYAAPGERIVEFFDAELQAGGLISFRRQGGELVVDVYRTDANVRVIPPGPRQNANGYRTP